MKISSTPWIVLLAAAAAPLGLAADLGPGANATPNQVVYLPQLPSAEALTSSAQAQGLTVASIRQVDGREYATYHFSSGPDSVVEYCVLPAAGSPGAAPAYTAPGSTVPVPTTPAPSVVYASTAPVYTTPAYAYSYDYDYGYPYAYYPVGWYGGYWGWGGRVGYGWGGVGFRGGWGGGYRGGSGFSGGFHGGSHR